MKYVLGVDGGQTKTMAAVAGQDGKILGTGLAGPSNYQITGLEAAMGSIDSAVQGALRTAGLGVKDLDKAVFGLSGADFPINYTELGDGLRAIYPHLDFELTNDTWVGFRSGTEKAFGGVVICGTGSNFAAASPDGRRITGRGMGYEWGSEGGAGSLIRQAVHWAFRSHDGTGPKSQLEQAVLDLLEFKSYDDLSYYMYQVQGQFSHIYMKAAKIVPALFQLAFQGDPVSQDILVRTGSCMGDIIGHMMNSLGMGMIPADVVLVGSIFVKGVHPIMVSSLKTACLRFVPLANFRTPETEPAGGAVLMALEELGIDTKGAVREQVVRMLPGVKD